jgi:ubiquinone/menaquinone biosynthesis C-methylase UbiE
MPTSWTAYLTAFHQDRPGITEEILGASRSAWQNPYEWLLEVISEDENLLDVACGSAPLLQAGWKSTWIGVDRSPAELARARANGAGNLVNAEARHLPFGNRQFTAVSCSMALMLLAPWTTVSPKSLGCLHPEGRSRCCSLEARGPSTRSTSIDGATFSRRYVGSDFGIPMTD